MGKVKNEWWSKEVSEKYNQLIKHSSFLLGLIVPLQLCIFLFITTIEPFNLYLIPCLIFFLIFSFGIFIRNSHSNLKFFFVILFSEGMNLMYLKISQELPEFKDSILMFSFLYFSIFELGVINSKPIISILVFKFWIEWCIPINFFFQFEPKNLVLFSCFFSGIYLSTATRFRFNEFEVFKANKSNEKSNIKNDFLIELIPDGFFILSEQLKVVYSNENIRILLKCSEDLLFQKLECIEYLPDRKMNSLNKENSLHLDILQCFEEEENLEICLGFTELEKSKFEWKVTLINWMDEKALVVICKNIDKAISHESSLVEIEVKNNLLRSVSHELKTPSYSIQAYAEEIKEKEGPFLSETSKRNLSIISMSSKMLLSLISDLLDYSKIMQGVFQIEKSHCNPLEISNDCLSLIRIQSEKKNLELKTRIDPELPEFVFTDSMRFKQILINLLSNALKFTYRGEIELCLTTFENSLKVEVSDTGVGIKKERLKEIFEIFNSDGDKITNPNGTGLGLNISNILAKELGHQAIEVNSKEGVGSSFSFFVCLNCNRHEEFLMNSSSSDNLLSIRSELELVESKKVPYDFKVLENKYAPVLVVEDSEFLREIISKTLKSAEISNLKVMTGFEAIKVVRDADEREQFIEVILMDLELPDMNGLEVSSRLRELYKEKSIKEMPNIIGHSAGLNEFMIRKCLEKGMVTTLNKPASPSEMIGTILNYLSNK